MRELDYRLEARNLLTLGHNLARFEAIVVPRPISDFTSTRVLTMEYVAGRKVTAVGPFGEMELDGEHLADQLFAAYLQQILSDGFFHADPHPGNVLLTPDGRLALIDLGMVSRLRGPCRTGSSRVLLAISEGHGESAANALVAIGERELRVRRLRVRRSRQHARRRAPGCHRRRAPARPRGDGALAHRGGRSGLRTPPALAMVGKALLNLDQVAEALDPQFKPQAAVSRHVATIMQAHMWRSATQGNAMTTLLDSKEFVERLPRSSKQAPRCFG